MDETLALWGRNIATARAAAELTQEELADRLGVSWPTLWRWENGRTEPRRRHKPRIAEALGVAVDQLFPNNEPVV